MATYHVVRFDETIFHTFEADPYAARRELAKWTPSEWFSLWFETPGAPERLMEVPIGPDKGTTFKHLRLMRA